MSAEDQAKVTEPTHHQPDLRDRLHNWVGERPLRLYSHRAVRENVANAVTTDIRHPVGSQNVPEKVEWYREQVRATVAHIIDVLTESGMRDSSLKIEIPDIEDRPTHTYFTIIIRREGDSWVSREVGTPSGRIISEAILFDSGETRMTLSYTGDRYVKIDADPNIHQSGDYPTGTRVLFANHAAAAGVIDFGRKTRKEIERKRKLKTSKAS